MANDEVDIDKMRALLQNKKAASVPIAQLNKGKDGTIDVSDAVVDALTPLVVGKAAEDLKPVLVKTIADGIEAEAKSLNADIDKATKAAVKSIADDSAKFDRLWAEKSDELMALANSMRRVEVVQHDGTTVIMEGIQHEKADLLCSIVAARQPAFMVGPAGTGKTAGAERAATALGLAFYAMSVGSQTSKSDIFGYKDANGTYHETPFYQAYKNGGVFLLDEADAGNANVLVGLNASLSNGYVFFPDGLGMTKMHENFRMIATANTFGNGASRQYVGRNQLDAATLDRFTVITWDIDPRIEESLASLSPTYGDRWLKVVRAVRAEAIDKLELRAVVSPRATKRGAELLEAGVPFEDVVDVALIANMPEAERDLLRNLAAAEWQKSAKAVRASIAAKTRKPKADLDELVSVFNGADDVEDDAEGLSDL